MWTNFKKQFIWGLGVFILVFFSANIFSNFGNKFVSKTVLFEETVSVACLGLTVNQEQATTTPASLPAQDNLKLAFVGDMMFDRGVKSLVKKNLAGDYAELFSKVETQLRAYDLLSANLEGPISDQGTDGGGLYSFRFDPQVLLVLKQVGFRVLSVANNHTFNWGREAFKNTLKRLSANDITYIGGGLSGSEAYTAKIINIKGVKIAFLAFSQFREGGINSTSTIPGIALIIPEEIEESIHRVRLSADLVVVSYHFGEEYEKMPDEFQQKYAKLAIEAGADLIIGHHPHVVQTLEQYKNAYIIYSLGNFIFDQYFSLETMQGGLLEVEVNLENKRIEKVTLKKVNLNKNYQIESII